MDARKTLLAALALSAGYLVGVEVGFAFTLEPDAVSLFWPPNAIVLAALLLAPLRSWIWLIAAILPAHLYSQLQSDVPLAMSLCWYVSNSAEALLGAGLIRSMLKRTPRFDVVSDVTVFFGSAVVVAPLVTSFVDAAFVAAVGWHYDGNYWGVWRTRLSSNAVAAMIFVPLIVIVGSTRPRELWGKVRECGAEATVLFALLLVMAWLLFHREYSVGQGATYLYAPLPLILWAALRLGVGGVAACMGIVALTSFAGEMRGLGPFSRAVLEDGALFLQIFLLLAASSFLLLAAALAELKEARATALRRKESLDLALRAARMGVWDWDVTNDRISWRWRPQCPAITMSSAELLALAHQDDRAAFVAAIERARAGVSHCELECRFNRGGAVRWIMMTGKVVRDRPGGAQRITGIFVDTTDWKARDAKEQLQRNQLAHLSRVAMLGELSGALAHELRQPLAAMLFNAQAGLRELAKPEPNLRELVAILEDIAADDVRAGEVIRRLRALFVRGAVQAELVDVRECVRKVLALEYGDLIVRNVTIDLDLAEVPLVRADPIQLQQVLLNVVSNACEAMMAAPAAERRLRISSRVEASEVRISVCDNGPGISEPERIFEPFYSTKADSVGLGLAISRTIMGAHGGRLWSANNADRGATFHLSLPCAPATEEYEASSAGRSIVGGARAS